MVSLLHHRADTWGKWNRHWVFPSMATEASPSAQENRRHCCLTKVLSALGSESWWGRAQKQRFAKPAVLALHPWPCSSLCLSSRRGGRTQAVCAGGTLLGKEAEGMAQWGSTWAFLSNVSHVPAVVLSWVCNGEKVLSVYPISWFLRLELVWQKIILQQIWAWFGILLTWLRSDDVSVATQGQDLNLFFVHSEEFSHSLNRNDTNLAWYPIPVPLWDEVTT